MATTPFLQAFKLEDIQPKLVEAVRLGLSQSACARYCGIDPETLRVRLQKDHRWQKVYETARAEAAVEAAQQHAIVRATGDARAIEKFLGVVDKDNWGEKAQGNINVNVLVPLFEGQHQKDIQALMEVTDGQTEESKPRVKGRVHRIKRIPGTGSSSAGSPEGHRNDQDNPNEIHTQRA